MDLRKESLNVSEIKIELIQEKYLFSFKLIKIVILHIVSKTYQTIDYKELKEIVGNLKDDEMNKLIKSKGWKKLEDNYVFVANHEENIKTKNIVEKIKFEGNCSDLFE